MRTLAWTTQLPSPSKSGRRSEILMTPSRSRAPWLPLPTGSSRALISGRFLVDLYVRFRLLGPWWQHRVRTVGHQSSVLVDCIGGCAMPHSAAGHLHGRKSRNPNRMVDGHRLRLRSESVVHIAVRRNADPEPASGPGQTVPAGPTRPERARYRIDVFFVSDAQNCN